FAEAGSPFYLDIPEPNAEAFQLTQQYHMRMVFETARMYNGPAPELPLKKIYGITSFELG
ncbi:MAG: GNAT family N-acetyltransferase, partial [Bacteroidales bacterium]